MAKHLTTRHGRIDIYSHLDKIVITKTVRRVYTVATAPAYIKPYIIRHTQLTVMAPPAPRAQELNLCRVESISDRGEGLTRAAVSIEIKPGYGKSWIARITGTHPKWGLDREFVSYDRSSLSRAGNGWVTVALDPGIYEASSVWRSFRMQRVIFKVSSTGQITILTKDEALDLVAA